MHGSLYKAKNIFAPDRYLYFFSDVPHLVKTVRNNLRSSGSGKNTKRLWVSTCICIKMTLLLFLVHIHGCHKTFEVIVHNIFFSVLEPGI